MADAERMPGAARDPGLQPERTALAWHRTLLSSKGVTLLIGVTAVRLDSPIVAVVAAVLASAGALFITDRSGGTWRRMSRAAVLVVALALAGVTLAAQTIVSR